jgi:predicted transcriptional regulator
VERKRPVRNTKSLEKVMRAKELKSKGHRNSEIARIMGVSPSRVTELLLGVDPTGKRTDGQTEAPRPKDKEAK